MNVKTRRNSGTGSACLEKVSSGDELGLVTLEVWHEFD